MAHEDHQQLNFCEAGIQTLHILSLLILSDANKLSAALIKKSTYNYKL